MHRKTKITLATINTVVAACLVPLLLFAWNMAGGIAYASQFMVVRIGVDATLLVVGLISGWVVALARTDNLSKWWTILSLSVPVLIILSLGFRVF